MTEETGFLRLTKRLTASPGPPPRSPSPPGLPPSTAPPRLEQEQAGGREKRKRVYTETYKLGREQGPLESLGHSQN
jgi:hypothetical protein